MNTNYRRVPTRFGPETRFEVKPVPPAPFRAVEETELERLKNRLLVRVLNEVDEPKFNVFVRRAANEAAALAWVLPFPLLRFGNVSSGNGNTHARAAASFAARRTKTLNFGSSTSFSTRTSNRFLSRSSSVSSTARNGAGGTGFTSKRVSGPNLVGTLL